MRHAQWIFSILTAALLTAACQHRDVSPPAKQVPLVRIASPDRKANPLVYHWALPSGTSASLIIEWKPSDEEVHGAITRMELSTPDGSFIFPKYSYEQLWCPSLADVRLFSRDGSDGDLTLRFGGGDGAGSYSADYRVRNGVLMSAAPIRPPATMDFTPATEPTPENIIAQLPARQRAWVRGK